MQLVKRMLFWTALVALPILSVIFLVAGILAPFYNEEEASGWLLLFGGLLIPYGWLALIVSAWLRKSFRAVKAAEEATVRISGSAQPAKGQE